MDGRFAQQNDYDCLRSVCIGKIEGINALHQLCVIDAKEAMDRINQTLDDYERRYGEIIQQKHNEMKGKEVGDGERIN